jgi:hypothetical protein
LSVGVRQDTRLSRYFHSIDPRATLAGVAEQLRSLSSIVVKGSKPPNFVRRYRHNPFLFCAATIVAHATAAASVTEAAAADTTLFIPVLTAETGHVPSWVVNRQPVHLIAIDAWRPVV